MPTFCQRRNSAKNKNIGGWRDFTDHDLAVCIPRADHEAIKRTPDFPQILETELVRVDADQTPHR